MKIEDLIKQQGIRLDIGGGNNPNPGFINIDILPLPNVDIVWDLEDTPWKVDGKVFPSESVSMATASHVLEHINPHKGVFIDVMNEIWRLLRPGAQFAFVVPHAESPGYKQDPTHCNMINETTMHYFEPMSETNLYQFYRPKPWRIVQQVWNPMGNLEVLLEKRPLDPSYEEDYQPFLKDVTKEKITKKSLSDG